MRLKKQFWKPITTAPKNRAILLYGQPESSDTVKYTASVVLSGYWDSLDEAWCSTTSDWTGPFVEASHWMELPEGPNQKD